MDPGRTTPLRRPPAGREPPRAANTDPGDRIVAAQDPHPPGTHFMLRASWEGSRDDEREAFLRTVQDYLDRHAVEEAIDSILGAPDVDVVSVNTDTGIVEGYREGRVDVLARRTVSRSARPGQG